MNMNKGVVKYPGYANGGRIPMKGLKNKRKATMAKIRQAEKRKRDAMEAAKEELRNPYSDYGYDDYQN